MQIQSPGFKLVVFTTCKSSGNEIGYVFVDIVNWTHFWIGIKGSWKNWNDTRRGIAPCLSDFGV